MCWGGSNTTNTTTNTSSLPPFVASAGMDNFMAAKSIASRPFPGYAGARPNSQTTGTQNEAMRRIASGADGWQPLLNKSTAATDAMSNPEAMRSRMNPYTENVLAPILRRLGMERDAGTKRLNAGAHQAGAFGDARHGIMGAENERNYMTQVSDTTGQGYAAAFDQALKSAQAEAQLYGQQAQMFQGANAADAGQMWQFGEAQRQIGNEGANFDYQQYLREINWPAEMLNLRIGALGNTPYPITQTSSTTGPGANSFAQNLGAFGLLAGGAGTAYKAFAS